MEQESTSRKVNETCIVTIVEKDGKLVKQDVEIPESEKIIDTLRGIVESKHCDLMALQRRFCYFTRWYDESYRYCLPFSYKETYIEMARKPKELTDKDLLLKRSYARKKIRDRLYHFHHGYPASFDQEVEDAMEAEEQKWKEEKFKIYLRYIRCMQYYWVAVNIENNPHIYLMYSREDIGWKDFTYKLSDDISIHLKTNFCYGSSSYFIINVWYKGVLFVPYSEVVRYYYANFYDYIHYTRSYRPYRENWDAALGFVVDFVNTAKKSPEEVIRGFFLKEISEMMEGLRDIMRSPDEDLAKVCKVDDNRNEYTVLRSVRPFSEQDQEEYRLCPDEFPNVYRLIKISGSLGFLENMKKFSDIVGEIANYISEIESMNRELLPKALDLQVKIEQDLKKQLERINEIDKKVEDLKAKIEPYSISLQKLIDSLEDTEIPEVRKAKEEDVIKKFNEENPDYASFEADYVEKEGQLQKLNHDYNLRNGLNRKVSECIKEINKYFDSDAA